MALLWTIGLLAAALLTPLVVVPGLDDSFGRFVHMERPSVFVLGVMPYLSAYSMVEFAALIVPRWRSLRHGGRLAGRARLDRAALWLALALAAMQSWLLVRWVDSVGGPWRGAWAEPEHITRWIGLATWLAGFALAWWVVRALSPRLLVNGFLLLAVVATRQRIQVTLNTAETAWSMDGLGPWLRAGLVLALMVYLAWRAWPWLLARGAPTSSIAPPLVATQVLMTAAAFGGKTLGGVLVPSQPTYELAHLGLTVVAAVLLARALDSRATWRAGAQTSAVIFVITAGIDYAATWFTQPILLPSAIEVLLGVTLILDAADDWRARRLGPWVTVAATTRVDDIATLISRLTPTLPAPGPRLRGGRMGQLLRFFAPYAPVEIQVPARDADAARVTLEEIR